MAEIALSAGVRLAWQIAGDLAFHEKDRFIEPRHLLFGVCSVGKLVATPGQERKTLELAATAKTEADRLDALARKHALDLAAVRRAVRQASAKYVAQSSPSIPVGVTVNRSPAARRVFESAARLAGQVELLTFLQALLQAGDAQVEEVTTVVPALASILGELQESPTPGPPSAIPLSAMRSDSRLVSVDAAAMGLPETLQIAEAIDATLSIQPKAAPGPIERLALLSEIAWEFGTQDALNAMLQRAVDQLLRIVTTADRCAILVSDPGGDDLLLRAHGPKGGVPMVSTTSARRAIAQKTGFIWTRGEDLSLSQKESDVQSGMYVPLVVNKEAIGVLCLDSSRLQSFTRDDLLLVNSLAHQLALAIANHELRQTLRQNADVLERLLTNFSPKVRTRLLQRARLGRLGLGGEVSVVTILCADIRGFSHLAASLQTEDVVSLLNEYFAALMECVFRNDGTVDKFVGDAILAVFGSPEADPQHCRKAVMAGVEMQQAMEEVSRRRAARGHTTCQIGVGIHTGEVLHGFIGSPERMEFTVIGDAVNRAARYCDAAKGAELLISPEVHQRVWTVTEAEQISVPTKHEGEFLAYRVNRLRARG